MLLIGLKIAAVNGLLGILLGMRLRMYSLMAFGPIVAVEIVAAHLAGITSASGLILLLVCAILSAQAGYVTGSVLGAPASHRRPQPVRVPIPRRDEGL